jgi:hypothetical protein
LSKVDPQAASAGCVSNIRADQKAGIAVLISAAPVDGTISSESGASRAATTLKHVMSTDLHFVTEPGAKR